MIKNNKQRYDLYIETPTTGLIKAAQAVLLESSGQVVQMAFLYTEEYLNNKHRFALDPVQLPLTEKELNIQCAGGMPGAISLLLRLGNSLHFTPAVPPRVSRQH